MSAQLRLRRRIATWAPLVALAACVVAPLKLAKDDSGIVLSSLSINAPDPSV
ncbi:MAG: hypothetical protein H7066_06395, partial [Cytophagaceae bacterium]|nr:hypothetical protein [Gemmatimonadaceae bacterium]